MKKSLWMTKAQKLLVLCLVFLVFQSFAFANGAQETTSTKEKKKVTMVVWSGNWADKLAKAENEFNSRHDDIELDIQMQSGDYSNYLGSKTAANDLADIFILTPYKQVESYAAAGRLMDLSDRAFVNKIYPNTKAASIYDGKMFGFPANVEFLGVFYNQDMFKAAGITEVPRTRADFLTACKKLEAAGFQPIAPTFKESWTLKHLFSVLMTNVVQDNMEEWLSELNSGNGTFNVPGIDDVFAFADIVKKFSGQKMMDADSTSGFNALANGKAAMLISGEFSLTTLSELTNPPSIGLFAVPVSNDATRNKLAVDVGIVYAVNSKPKNKDATLTVLDFLSDNSDPNGYIAAVTDRIGSAPSTMPFKLPFNSPAYAQYTEYVESGNVVPWVYQQYVNGFDVVSGEIFQGYMAGAKNQQTVLSELDSAYRSFL